MHNPIPTIIEDEDLLPYLERLQMSIEREFREYNKLIIMFSQHNKTNIIVDFRIHQFHMNRKNPFRAMFNLNREFIGYEKLTMH